MAPARVWTSTELVSFVASASVGQQIVFSIYRQGETLEITVDVGEQIQSALDEQQEQQQTQQGYPGNSPWGRP
jgi:S1-C subfamily serine protease